MSKNYYDILGVSKISSSDEIKKAYRKMAMKYHPDRNKGNKEAEKKFKEINEAYSVLSDTNKKKQYDTFGSTSENSFSGNSYSSSNFGGFEDIFGDFSSGTGYKTKGFNVNIEDLFGGFSGGNTKGGYDNKNKSYNQEKENLDFEKTYEVPIFDLILGCHIEVSGVYGKKVKLKIPAGTSPGTKLRVKGLGKSEKYEKGNLIVLIKPLMPKNISPVDKKMLETIRENVGY